ncbi:MAG: sodium:proton antiporter [Candidatus Lloydbacteria bacterium RIFCSPHIGHO2_02_FULL_54_17]|uniref:Sodium:proton antiporter n=1 Tax=Candidatus Lloydbacteria bacterium RIFCSPHIGHO2_02_FULL_54_17 TaxID=1798664 RepID=A0A1G2DDS1_9BACT|nr:MAG: sodium:proton antiporter [Candidatus Lloydbacteria bacterium RIFCSPHIGHO2_01_FULL_54_11]OGZ11779.1 MAG: sodium:proton antiporter [Candidatus Lloydbacteria bacterium RIFCSPHIGHO2_02_FULL_54_17]OGZ14308.1 MAG: sodium:proton antiporter [Candidatus Lloydbacteria bacterium RIFCSPLOWO2_01_FULL_54_18]OGZ16025.1 MAG: sodium:proton antiporter [Candidatus Lloydbacteria bacterium RIFCSPLOWO2_02_FULL_54_12]
MHWYDTVALLLTTSALFSFLNYKFFRLPKTVGLMLISLVAVFALFGLREIGVDMIAPATKAVQSIDFSEALLQGILCFLLFAGALHINLGEFLEQKWPIGILASLGVVISAAVIGTGAYFLFPLFGFELPFLMCLLFGALISPTDPVATLALLKTAKVPESVKMKIAGEALFNDGTGVVLFVVLLALFSGDAPVTTSGVALLFLREAAGGILYGLAIGYAAFELIRRVDDYHVEILLSLALVAGGYALASVLHVSGPLAVVVAGLVIGNHARKFGMSEKTRHNLDIFWNVVDDILNVLLFVLVGFEALLVNVKFTYALAGFAVIPLVLFGRFASVSLSSFVSYTLKPFGRNAIPLLTWGGLRGGVSFALALALPHGESRDALILITYMVVVFSVLVQGLTMGRLVRRFESDKSVTAS